MFISKKTLYLLPWILEHEIGLQIYEGQIVKQHLPWTGWLASNSFASSRNQHSTVSKFIPKPLLKHGERKRI